jgi:hypothetical protein
MTKNMIDGFNEDSGTLMFYVSPDNSKGSTTCHVSHVTVFDRMLTDEEIHNIFTGNIPRRTLWRRLANWFTRTFHKKRKDNRTLRQTMIDLNPLCYWTYNEYPLAGSKLVIRRFDQDGWHDVGMSEDTSR